MTMALERLRHCYETVFSMKCSSEAGSIMSEVIRRAFSDPFYLRFAYKANCDLHKMPSSIKRSPPPPHAHRGRYRHQRHHGPREHDHVEGDEPMGVTERTHHVIKQRQNGGDGSRDGSMLPSLENSAGSLVITKSSLVTKIGLLLICVLTLHFNQRFALR